MYRHFTLLFAFLAMLGLNAATVEFVYHFNDPQVRQVGGYQVISFENTLLTGRTGEPALPYRSVQLLLPPGEEAVSVTYDYAEETLIQGAFTLYPRQVSRPLSEGASGRFAQNLSVYSSREKYPASANGNFSTHFLRGHSVLQATFTPITYVPADGTVSYYRTVTVTVETRPTARASQALQNLQANKALPGIRVHNPEALAQYSGQIGREEPYQLLIITPEAFVPSFQPLQNLCLVRGLRSEIATTEFISANMAGADLQEKVRNHIIQQYQQNGIEYVLLGGDVEHIPSRGFYCFVQSSSVYEDYNIPSDLYYSALDGNWNTDGDMFWGEIGEDDLLPEVAVARFPSSNLQQLARLLNKTIRYQDEPVTGELRNPLMAGEELWQNPLTYGEDYLELLIGYREDNGYTTDGIPVDYEFNKMYDHIAYWGGYQLIDAINQGTSFIHHSGHANQSYVMRLNISDINNENFPLVNGSDHNYALVYTHGCLCGAFDENDCIGEAMVNIDNFAVAGAFNSRYGWFNEGQTEGPSAHLHREFVDALYNDRESRIGMAHMISKAETSVWVNAPGQWEEGALRWCFYDCNIFGDPTLGVWTDEPISIETSYPEEVMVGDDLIPVTVTSNGQPAEGMMCVIMSGESLLGSAVTDASGYAVISLPGGFLGYTDAELVVSGYNCLPHHYTLHIAVGLDDIHIQDTQVSVSPNPFSDQALLRINTTGPGPVELIFYTTTGQMISKKVAEASGDVLEMMINGDELPYGMVYLQVKSAGGVFTSRLVRVIR